MKRLTKINLIQHSTYEGLRNWQVFVCFFFTLKSEIEKIKELWYIIFKSKSKLLGLVV